jgi:hypothetical protein
MVYRKNDQHPQSNINQLDLCLFHGILLRFFTMSLLVGAISFGRRTMVFSHESMVLEPLT